MFKTIRVKLTTLVCTKTSEDFTRWSVRSAVRFIFFSITGLRASAISTTKADICHRVRSSSHAKRVEFGRQTCIWNIANTNPSKYLGMTRSRLFGAPPGKRYARVACRVYNEWYYSIYVHPNLAQNYLCNTIYHVCGALQQDKRFLSCIVGQSYCSSISAWKFVSTIQNIFERFFMRRLTAKKKG